MGFLRGRQPNLLPYIRFETKDAKQGSSSDKSWWREKRRPDTAPTASTVRTGYWDVMTLFRTGHSESVVQSKDQSEVQL